MGTTKSPFFQKTNKKLVKSQLVVMKSALILLASMATLALAEPEARPSGLKVEYISVPETCEQKALNGQQLTMHYTGTLEDGTKFDSSVDRNEPFKFQIGVGQVIKGWEEGVLGMCVGEKRQLIVPPELGYGDQGAGEIIPGGATLFFDIELLETEDGPAPVNVFKQIDIDADSALSREELSVYLKQQVEAMAQAGGEQAQQAQEMLKDQDKLVEEIFSHEDKDKDGYISHEEFSGPKHDELSIFHQVFRAKDVRKPPQSHPIFRLTSIKIPPHHHIHTKKKLVKSSRPTKPEMHQLTSSYASADSTSGSC